MHTKMHQFSSTWPIYERGIARVFGALPNRCSVVFLTRSPMQLWMDSWSQTLLTLELVLGHGNPNSFSGDLSGSSSYICLTYEQSNFSGKTFPPEQYNLFISKSRLPLIYKCTTCREMPSISIQQESTGPLGALLTNSRACVQFATFMVSSSSSSSEFLQDKESWKGLESRLER